MLKSFSKQRINFCDKYFIFWIVCMHVYVRVRVRVHVSVRVSFTVCSRGQI